LRLTQRLLAVIEWYDAKMAEVAVLAFAGRDPMPISKLERMVVAPGLQGKGVRTPPTLSKSTSSLLKFSISHALMSE
jgi:hypothetical protein